ncbi:glycerate kinase [Desulfovibrio sp. 86]|jgi:glycerate kinase|uniref:Glycerate kinase n=1 Tax=uncultured Desulfovibrio sp. TaxID=167968 RepID=A0A212L6M6_9BACT|nr:glycerate kinase [Desulfovibrio sp. 86]SCM73196.1 Glycerate kinase [uncultured Desulfovibrio sp.]VZH34020.1 Glycerate kinase [Desulfovibrio sp. 86]
MKILVAPDSFKGSVSAIAVARAMGRGIHRIFPDAAIEYVPIADGGEGTVQTVVAAAQGEIRQTTVSGPLGTPVVAQWGLINNGATAVIEMAAASGLMLLAAEEKNPLLASTFGVGQLVLAALDAGVSAIVIGIGGSATNDGGSGFARALGARFLDASGKELPEGGAALQELARIDGSALDPRLASVDIMVACDVTNPLCGPTGASAVFGPQKGATPAMVQQLDAALAHYADLAEKSFGKSVRDIPGAGAAGGLGAGLLLFTNARLRSGIDIVLQVIGLEKKLEGASLVFTGEGNTDFQTTHGKAPVGVAKLAAARNIPVICLSGGLDNGYEAIYAQGIDAAAGCPAGPASLEDCIAKGETLVEAAAERTCRLLAVGMRLA